MNEGLELHDSALASARRDGERVVIEFERGYIHRSEGRPGRDPGTGWVQPLRVILEEVADAPPDEVFEDGDIWDGEIECDRGTVHRNVVELPCALDGGVVLRIRLSRDGSTRVYSARSLRIEATGEARCVEWFTGAGPAPDRP